MGGGPCPTRLTQAGDVFLVLSLSVHTLIGKTRVWVIPQAIREQMGPREGRRQRFRVRHTLHQSECLKPQQVTLEGVAPRGGCPLKPHCVTSTF